jgi:hypothetical protein
MFYQTRGDALAAVLRRVDRAVGIDELIDAARDAKVTLPIEAVTGNSASFCQGQSGRLAFRIIEDKLTGFGGVVDKLINKR